MVSGRRSGFGLSSAARPGAPAAHGALSWDLTRLVNAHCLRVSSINSAEWRGRRGLLTPLGSPLPHRSRLGPRPAPRQGTEGTPRTPLWRRRPVSGLSRRLADGPGRSRAPLRAAGTCYFHFYFFCCKKLSCFLWSNAWERPQVVKRTASGCGERPRQKPDARGCRGPLDAGRGAVPRAPGPAQPVAAARLLPMARAASTAPSSPTHLGGTWGGSCASWRESGHRAGGATLEPLGVLAASPPTRRRSGPGPGEPRVPGKRAQREVGGPRGGGQAMSAASTRRNSSEGPGVKVEKHGVSAGREEVLRWSLDERQEGARLGGGRPWACSVRTPLSRRQTGTPRARPVCCCF